MSSLNSSGWQKSISTFDFCNEWIYLLKKYNCYVPIDSHKVILGMRNCSCYISFNHSSLSWIVVACMHFQFFSKRFRKLLVNVEKLKSILWLETVCSSKNGNVGDNWTGTLMVILSIDIIKANGNNPRGISRHLSSKCSVWTSVSQSASVTKIILFLTTYCWLIEIFTSAHSWTQQTKANQGKIFLWNSS